MRRAPPTHHDPPPTPGRSARTDAESGDNHATEGWRVTDTCDHCGRELDDDRVEGDDGEYCPGTCQWDAEVMGVTPDELRPRRSQPDEVERF